MREVYRLVLLFFEDQIAATCHRFFHVINEVSIVPFLLQRLDANGFPKFFDRKRTFRNSDPAENLRPNFDVVVLDEATENSLKCLWKISGEIIKCLKYLTVAFFLA